MEELNMESAMTILVNNSTIFMYLKIHTGMLSYKSISLCLVLIYNLPLITFSQKDVLADIFVNNQPIWSHAAIDSSAIGYKGRTGMDYFCCLAERKVLIHDGALYLVYLNTFEIDAGNYLEKLDLNNGKTLWSNAYDLRHSTKREYTNRFFINSNNQLELLNFRYSYDTVWWLYPFWDSGKLSVRKYDLQSGREIYKQHSPIDDPAYPLFKVQGYQHSYLHKDQNGDYIVYTMRENVNIPAFDMARTRLDSSGRYKNLDGVHTMTGTYKNLVPYTEIPILNNHSFDTIVRLLHTFKNNPYVTGDTMEFKIYLLDPFMNEIASFDVTNQMSKIKEYYLLKVGDGIIGILGIEYNKNKYPLHHIYIFDFSGNLLEEIILPHTTNQQYGQCNGILKLKNEKGVLITCRGREDKTSRSGFAFYKSDGNGNIKLHAEIITRDSFGVGDYVSMYEVEPDIVLTAGRFRQQNLTVGTYEQTERYITALWNLNNITTSTDDRKEDTGIKFYPVPSSAWLRVNLDAPGDFHVNVYNLNGQLILNQKINSLNNIIDIQNLPGGNYIVELIDEKGLLHYNGKIIKEN